MIWVNLNKSSRLYRMTLGPDSRGRQCRKHPFHSTRPNWYSVASKSYLLFTLDIIAIAMAQPPHNPLLHPPFFEIQGINPSSPLSTQMEQIDQLNTLLLQEIDANFAKFHQVVTSRILPEIKRFAIAGEPTREAAHVSLDQMLTELKTDCQFWKTFYEAAAGVRSTVEGPSTIHDENQSQVTYEDHEQDIPRDDDQSFSSAHEEGSFMFGKGAVGSTPLGKKQYTGNESWEDSIESPFDKNDRKLRELNIGGEYDDESDMPTPSLPSGYRMPPSDDSSMSTSPSIRPPGDRSSSSRPMSSTPKAARTTHITDLRTTPLNAKFPKPKSKSGLRHAAPADDSDDDLLGGMSPPRTMNFGALPPRVAAINAAVRNKTPGKATQADGILNDVMSEITRGAYADSPDMPQPDFLRRYTMHAQASSSTLDPSQSSPLAPSRDTGRETRKSMANTSFGSDIVSRPAGLDGNGDDSDDSFSSDDSGTVPPPQGDYRSDISYTTNTPGATARYGNVGDFSTTMHGGGHRGQGDDNEVFGVPAQGQSGEKPSFGLKKQDEMYTYMGGRLEDAAGMDATPAKINGKAEVLGAKR